MNIKSIKLAANMFIKNPLLKEYKFFLTDAPYDIKSCTMIKKNVYEKEFNKKNLVDDGLDDFSSFIVAKDKTNNKVIGFCRVTPLSEMKNHNNKLFMSYNFNLIPKNQIPLSNFISRLCILPEYRKSYIGLALGFSVFSTFGKEKPIGVQICEARMLRFQKLLGAVPFGPQVKTENGIRYSTVIDARSITKLKETSLFALFISLFKGYFLKKGLPDEWYEQNEVIVPEALYSKDSKLKIANEKV